MKRNIRVVWGLPVLPSLREHAFVPFGSCMDDYCYIIRFDSIYFIQIFFHQKLFDINILITKINVKRKQTWACYSMKKKDNTKLLQYYIKYYISFNKLETDSLSNRHFERIDGTTKEIDGIGEIIRVIAQSGSRIGVREVGFEVSVLVKESRYRVIRVRELKRINFAIVERSIRSFVFLNKKDIICFWPPMCS